MANYHYEYRTYTDNLGWGRILIGQYLTRTEAHRAGVWANKGCFVVEKTRVYNK